MVNADLGHNLPRQHLARNQAKLAAETRRFFRRRQRQPHIVRGYFAPPSGTPWTRPVLTLGTTA
ncbi:hypothetical protein [Streptomyces sp. NPDC052092]|uniref:hypothetical protein n=1 Tax=Streptomyces sp. NPDC052092 TaxID=3365685 RepID=UPI0037D32913